MMKTRRGKRILRGLRRPFEWLGVVLGLLVFTNLPHRALLAVCDFAGAVMFAFDRRGRDLALFNLRVIEGVYPPERDFRAAHVTPPTRRETLILKRSYRNMARTIGHAFWTCRNARARVAAVGEMSARGKAFLAANKPAVTVIETATFRQNPQTVGEIIEHAAEGPQEDNTFGTPETDAHRRDFTEIGRAHV